MKQIFFLALLILSFWLPAQNEMETDLTGKTTRKELQNHPSFGQVFMEEYTGYHPDNEVLRQLIPGIYSYDMVIVLGIWCGDSQEQVPAFIKILDKLDYNTNNITFIAVDREKQADVEGLDSLNIKRVPTFIILDENGREKGRIVETPKTTLEEDLKEII